MTMSPNPNMSEAWIPCPRGSLGQFARREKTRQRRRFLVKASGIAAVVALSGGVGFWALRPRGMSEPNFGGVTCTEVRTNAMAMMAGTLPSDLLHKIQTHLSQCGECQAMLEKMKADAGGKSMTSASPAHREPCGCSQCRSTLLAANSAQEAVVASRRVALSQTLDGKELHVATR
jgi:hypothetical protein